MALDLFAEFTQLVQALDARGVDHAVVGALAVAIHGAPRATTDIDLLVQRAAWRLRQVEALRRFCLELVRIGERNGLGRARR